MQENQLSDTSRAATKAARLVVGSVGTTVRRTSFTAVGAIGAVYDDNFSLGLAAPLPADSAEWDEIESMGPSNDRLIEIAKKFRAPQEWYDETVDLG